MSKQKLQLDRIEVASPCDADWNEMTGNNTVRFCSHCAKDVHDLSAMTRKQAKKLVAASNGKLCVRYVRRPDGRIHTAGQKLYRISGRASQIAAGVFGATLAISNAVYAQGDMRIAPEQTTAVQTESKKRKPKANGATSSISFTVLDPNAAAIAEARVTLKNQKTGEEFVVLANQEGVAQFNLLAFGRYELSVESPHFQSDKGRIFNLENAVEPNIKIHLSIGGMMGVVVVVDNYEMPLLYAISQNDIDAVKRLIAEGANIKAKEANGTTALHVAVEAGNAEIAAMLLSAGAQINAKTKSKQTPLLMIDEDATPELVRLLIAHGANVNAQNDEGESALIKAADDDKLEIVKILLEAGANLNLRDSEGDTALSRTGDDEIEKLLKQYGAVEDKENQ